MTAKRKRTAKRYLDGSPITRPVDQWRSYAAIPLLPWSITREGTPEVWTLTEDGKRIAQWSDSDVPGLGEWLWKRLDQLHGAWHVARTQLETVQRLAKENPVAVEARKKQAKEKRDRKNLYRVDFQSEALALRKKHPAWYADDIRAFLKERYEVSKEALRALKIPRRRASLPRP